MKLNRECEFQCSLCSNDPLPNLVEKQIGVTVQLFIGVMILIPSIEIVLVQLQKGVNHCLAIPMLKMRMFGTQ